MSMCPHPRRSGSIGHPNRPFCHDSAPRALYRRYIHHWSLEFEGRALFWCSNGPAAESGKDHMGNVGIQLCGSSEQIMPTKKKINRIFPAKSIVFYTVVLLFGAGTISSLGHILRVGVDRVTSSEFMAFPFFFVLFIITCVLTVRELLHDIRYRGRLCTGATYSCVVNSGDGVRIGPIRGYGRSQISIIFDKNYFGDHETGKINIQCLGSCDIIGDHDELVVSPTWRELTYEAYVDELGDWEISLNALEPIGVSTKGPSRPKARTSRSRGPGQHLELRVWRLGRSRSCRPTHHWTGSISRAGPMPSDVTRMN